MFDEGDISLSLLQAVADPVRIHILRSLRDVTDATAADLTAGALASKDTLRRHLEALSACGLVQKRPGETDGETTGRPAARFKLDPAVRAAVSELLGH